MPQGKILSFDEKARQGQIQPDEGGETLTFSLDALKDYKTGELVAEDEHVTYQQGDDGSITSVHRIATRGYE